MLVVWVVALYGIVSLVGGVIGYVKAKSIASLIAGTISGVLLLLCAYGIGQGVRAAAIGSVVIAAALGGRFAGTWRRTRRVMPDLVMAILGLCTLLVVAARLRS